MTENLEYKIALLVDGPNMFTADFNQMRDAAKKYGELVITEVYLTKDVSEGMLESTFNSGFQPVIGTLKDVDTALMARAIEIVCSPRYTEIDLIALGGMDGDYLPLTHKSREYGKKTLMIGLNTIGNSTALKNSVDFFEAVEERQRGYQ